MLKDQLSVLDLGLWWQDFDHRIYGLDRIEAFLSELESVLFNQYEVFKTAYEKL